MWKVGQRVWDVRLGWGKIREITEGYTLPITVKFTDDKIETYTRDGKLYEKDLYPSLYPHKVKIIPVKTTQVTCEDNVRTAPKNNLKEEKPRPSLLPMDVLIKWVCPAYEEGILKYKRESWRLGFKVSDLIDAAQRHINTFFYDQEDFDPDAEKLGIKKHHLSGAIFSLISILNTLDNRPELDDRDELFNRKGG